MKPIFSIHHGEYLVGKHLEAKYGKEIKIWVPGGNDDGIDLLISDKTGANCVSVQVKYSRDYPLETNDPLFNIRKSGGWWQFRTKAKSDENEEQIPAHVKISSSQAKVWVLVLYNNLNRECNFVVMSPQDIAKRYRSLGRTGKTIDSYLWVLGGNAGRRVCIEGRDLRKREIEQIAAGKYHIPKPRDWSDFLDNWELISKPLNLKSRRRSDYRKTKRVAQI